ncbi:glycoside hydrolase family 92 protein [Mucilaginibacter robiniae]|uniref:Glycoside hydrolase family 92 protein n=1 Tax=Mucilaginibacter robiniae TaxID=2728022 RepID=A0A7L5E1D1_9SPHI|nr:glycoside hydrolase domain-containing protein [Mucilaginibacter robiniae]QJD96841.1 glycoside hydrolase family 92 protein [Mucilaginibacter robiniae]
MKHYYNSTLTRSYYCCTAIFLFLVSICSFSWAQQLVRSSGNELADEVNVFLGSSGDHGQMSPAASYPFSMLSIGPQTYPNLHMGYEHKAKTFLGFTHNRFEGVGCQGSGGNILIKPFLVDDSLASALTKSTESAAPGYYQVGFSNGIKVNIAVCQNAGIEQYSFPAGHKPGFLINLSHTLANRFVAEEHQLKGNELCGWIDSRTTCNVGTYRIYYSLKFDQPVQFTPSAEHILTVTFPQQVQQAQIRIALSSVDVAHAEAALSTRSYEQLKAQSQQGWNQVLNRVQVKGNSEREKLFYSLLYRTVQSPYVISEPDGSYRATDGSLQHTTAAAYNGWAIWDNYRTQLPLLSILYPERYKAMTNSIADLYHFGKKDYATQHEPSNTVRTEHAIVVLLDAYRKGYPVDWNKITDSLVADVNRLDFSHPDKALESSYDTWALSQILRITGKSALSKQYLQKASAYKDYWNKDFKDLTKRDVDQVSARGLYQGTIWQYRWFVPFDAKGLIALIGGEQAYLQQLNQFFDNDYYNHANEPDIQAPLMYNFTSHPWQSQALMHKYAVDTVVQYYFNDNSRGIDPFVDVIYKNQPDTYIRTMDDDAGAMSAWYVFAACGFSPACVGWPVYYLNAPLFKEVSINLPANKHFIVRVNNYTDHGRYIQSATLNGKPLNRNWITHQEIMQGGTLTITASDQPDKTWGTVNQWITDINKR